MRFALTSSMLPNARGKLLLLTPFLSLAAFAQEQAPLQADTRVRVNNNQRPIAMSFATRLAGGPATLTGSVRNLPGGDTALVALQFAYTVNEDIALDEIISQIVVSVEDLAGNMFSTVAIDPNTIHLNPNRVPLCYSATLYTPEHTRGRNGYIVRVQVFGNYE
jgi:hypothetical protein